MTLRGRERRTSNTEHPTTQGVARRKARFQRRVVGLKLRSVHSLTSQPGTDPTPIYRCRDGLYAADLLAAALVWLDFFTWLNDHPSDNAGICGAFDIKERPTDVMLTLFVAMGFLKCDKEIFSLTELAREHLVKQIGRASCR